MSMRAKPTEAEFDELKRIRDERLNKVIRGVAIELGVDPDSPHHHINYGGGSPGCYCACPDGPCQHDWSGPSQDILDDNDEVCGSEVTCARCGQGSMFHDMRVLP